MVKSSAACRLTLYPSDDLFESMQSHQDAVFFSGAIRTAAQDLSRIASDIRLLSSGPTTGLGELTCPPVQPGSSIMPGKVNPVLAEMLNQAMFHVMGSDHTITLCAQAGQLELNVMMPIMAHNLNEMMIVMIGSVKMFTEKLVVGLVANREGRKLAAQNPILVTALNPVIGYEAGAKSQEIAGRNRTLLDIVVATA